MEPQGPEPRRRKPRMSAVGRCSECESPYRSLYKAENTGFRVVEGYLFCSGCKTVHKVKFEHVNEGKVMPNETKKLAVPHTDDAGAGEKGDDSIDVGSPAGTGQ